MLYRRHSIEESRAKIFEIAQEMLSDKCSFIYGCRQIHSLRFDANVAEDDEDFLRLVGIDSETDDLPFGNVRNLWSTDSLANKQDEIDRAERWAKKVGSVACTNLVSRFDPENI